MQTTHKIYPTNKPENPWESRRNIVQLYRGNPVPFLLEYDNFVRTTDISNHNLQFYLDGMNEENGEISGVLKRVRRGDFGEIPKRLIEERGIRYVIMHDPIIKLAFLKEIGDRHWYTTRLLQELNETWDTVEDINQGKLGVRKDKDMIMGHGDERENLIDSETKKKQ